MLEYKVGEEVVRCSPFAHVVSQANLETTCDNCMAIAAEGRKFLRCKRCKVARYCHPNCQKISWNCYHHVECKYFQNVMPRIPTDTVRLLTRLIIALSCDKSVKSVKLPDGSERSFFDLEHHKAEILDDKCRMDAFDAFYNILQFMFLSKVPTKIEMMEIFSRAMINSFNIMTYEYQSIGVGIYLAASIFDHSCEPNAMVSFNGQYLVVKCISEKPVKFEDLRISYISLNEVRGVRKGELMKQYYFDCQCPRCVAIDGVDRYMAGSFKCAHCQAVVPLDDKTVDSEDFECPKCNVTLTKDHLKQYFKIRDEIVSRTQLKSDPLKMDNVIHFLSTIVMVFHPLDSIYYNILEYFYDKSVQAQNTDIAFKLGKELLLAYSKYYPKYDINTALLMLRMARLSMMSANPHMALNLGEKAFVYYENCHAKSKALDANFRRLFEDIHNCLEMIHDPELAAKEKEEFEKLMAHLQSAKKASRKTYKVLRRK